MTRRTWLSVFAVALLVGTLLSLVASSSPDGLERVADDHGLLGRAITTFEALIPDYVFPGTGETVLATALAGFVGTFVVFVIIVGIGSVALLGKPPQDTPSRSCP